MRLLLNCTVVILLAAACGGGSPPAEPTSTVTTVAPSPTAGSTSASTSLPTTTTTTTAAATAPLEVAATWISAYEAGDVDTFQALMHPDATALCVNCAYDRAEAPYFTQVGESTADVADSRLLALANGSLNADCTADGSLVTCETLRTSDFGFASADGEPDRQWAATYELTVAEGLVTRRVLVHQSGNPFDFGIVAEYERWLKANHPDAHAEGFAFGTILLTTLEQFELHQEFVPQFWVST
ncbi:MAG: hypothetical protein HKN91_12465 [Acidimicrobiia bacterium]|nr:hypothetical protein [Acidimicrobiia bacterium]